jgi:hypothetical protein
MTQKRKHSSKNQHIGVKKKTRKITPNEYLGKSRQLADKYLLKQDYHSLMTDKRI